MSKLFVIFGATGQQGGALVDYLLQHPEFSKAFHLRGVTRNASSSAAEELKKMGVEIVEADLDKPETLPAAVTGSYGVFAVTDFWIKGIKGAEIAQGKAVADAALAAGVGLFIWSSLPNITKVTGGKLTTIHHYDSKAEVEEYIRGLPFPSSVFFMPGWFMQNVWHKVAPKPKIMSNGKVFFGFAWPPQTKVPLIDITDIGKYLAPVLRNPLKYNGCRLTAATAFYTAQETVDTWSAVSGKNVILPTEEDIPFLSSDPVQQSFSRPNSLLTEWAYFGPTGEEDLRWTLEQLDEKLTTWKEFLESSGPWFEE